MIIGISGKRSTGKTTLANYLVKDHGFVRVSFADYLRDCTKQLWNMEELLLLDPKLKETPFKDYTWTPRDFMIDFGKFMRKYDPDYWLDAALQESFDKAVFDDVRYPNEADWIKKVGGKLIRLHRDRSLTAYTSEIDDPSETSLDTYQFDDWFTNNGTLDSLYQYANKIR